MDKLTIGEVKAIKLGFHQSLIFLRSKLYEKMHYIKMYQATGMSDKDLGKLKRSTASKIGHITRKLNKNG